MLIKRESRIYGPSLAIQVSKRNNRFLSDIGEQVLNRERRRLATILDEFFLPEISDQIVMYAATPIIE